MGMLPKGNICSSTAFEHNLKSQSLRDAQLYRLGVALGAALAASWVLGAAGASVAWLVLLLAAAGAVWRQSVCSLLEAAAAFEALRVRRRRALAAGETAEWLNVAINRWWVLSSDSVFALVKEHLEPLLNDAKPGIVESVELRQLSLGGGSPELRVVRLLDVAPCGRRLPPPLRPRRSTPRAQLALEADVAVDSDDFCLLLRTRLFGKGMGVDLDLAVEKLNISGRISGTLTLSLDVPFPHISHLSLTFIEKPQVWFSVRILKSVQMMEVPVLKTWLHSLVLEALVSALVDPSSLELNLSPSNAPPRPPGRDGTEAAQAKGVLTVTVSVLSGAQQWEDSNAPRWLVLSLGGQRRRVLLGTEPCCCSFLVGSLQQDILLVKVKSKKLINTVTIMQSELPLANLNLENLTIVDHLLQKKGSSKSSFPSLPLRLQYSPLPDINLDKGKATQAPDMMEETVAGVLFVFVHCAEGLVTCDTAECNPYCTIFSNRKKVKTTHYLKGTANPRWESLAQFFVNDYRHAALSFVVCSWSPRKMADTDLLGLATLSLSQGDTWVVQKALPLSGNLAGGQVLVSVVFWPVPSVAQQDPLSTEIQADEDDAISDGHGKRNSNSWMQQAKMLLTHREQEGPSDISSLLSHGLGLMEVNIIRAHDLESKDLNGFSDPYCELKVSGEVKYKSSVKKKTLNPCWDESAIMALPRNGETLDVMLWDHDTFGMNDFLGSLSLGLDDIRRASLGDEALFFSLQGVRSGAVELKIRVISEDTESQSCHASSNSSTSSPRLPVRRQNEAHVPPPAPPRTVSLTTRVSSRQTGGTSVTAGESNTQMECKPTPTPNGSVSITLPETSHIPPTVPRLMVTELDAVCVGDTGTESVQLTDLRTGLTVDTSDGNVEDPPSPGDETAVFKKCTSDYSSFRVMKQRMKRGLRLRRFKSEASVHADDDEMKAAAAAAAVPAAMALSVEPSGGGESDATELLGALAHAVSQPDIRRQKTVPLPRRPADLKVPPPLRPDHYSGVEGKVVQAQGLHVARIAQLYCRVRFQGVTSPGVSRGGNMVTGGRTVAKSRLLPAVPNPRFDLAFQLDQPEQIPRHAVLLFEVRGTGKELIGARRVTLQDLLSAAASGSNEVHTWLALNNGASLEVHVAHGRELKKAGRKIFRSWSVHRIGKV
ncbi:uncharacterized protein LOC126094274 [Schistocerca cancellata]|uniref:uncharacterized protein LOC126094274 n=1 Tax=Schistocerca cancellata TaxID=274614 RepID=UPI002118EFA5|nr:uncharacterized protein LOC126094274 [Schistocerca cancellata]